MRNPLTVLNTDSDIVSYSNAQRTADGVISIFEFCIKLFFKKSANQTQQSSSSPIFAFSVALCRAPEDTRLHSGEH
jgi:hypothetical protein